jgi:hypothetical protein
MKASRMLVEKLEMKNSGFLDLTPCRIVYFYRCFGGTCCLHIQKRRVTLKVEKVVGYRERDGLDRSCGESVGVSVAI